MIAKYNQDKKQAEISILYRLNPSAKFMWLISFSLSIYMIKELIVIFFILIITICLVPLAGLKLKDLKKNILYLLQIQLISTFFSVFGWHDSRVEPLFYTFPKDWVFIGGALPVFRKGLYLSFRNPMVITIVLIIALIFITTTDPAKFAASLNHQMKVPIRISQCLIIGMNFIPIIENEVEIIRKSQIARGENLFSSSKKKKIKESISSVLSFLTTLIIIILRKVDNLSISLDKRGLGLYKTRTEEPIEWNKCDSLLVVMVFLFPISILLYNFGIIHVSVPSVYNLCVNIGIINWVKNNEWIFILVLISFCIYIILFFLKHFKRNNKAKKKTTKQNELISFQDNITERKIENATNILENLNDNFDIPITAGISIPDIQLNQYKY